MLRALTRYFSAPLTGVLTINCTKAENNAAIKIQTHARMLVAKRQRARHAGRMHSIYDKARAAADDIRSLSRPGTAHNAMKEAPPAVGKTKLASQEQSVDDQPRAALTAVVDDAGSLFTPDSRGNSGVVSNEACGSCAVSSSLEPATGRHVTENRHKEPETTEAPAVSSRPVFVTVWSLWSEQWRCLGLHSVDMARR